ncbi:MAG: hypothetical protein EOO60_06340 [Hymenobacter sp.]|nr:MAG: hypothetical protein EOO60_06340 [Hymenobacter sp.]
MRTCRLVIALQCVLLGLGVAACQHKQAERKRVFVSRPLGRPRPSLLIPDSALYQLANYLMHRHTLRWVTGDSVLTYDRESNVVLAYSTPAADEGPEISQWMLEQLVAEKLVTPTDTLFFRHQQANTRGFALDAKKMPDCIVISATEVDSAYQEMTREGVEQLHKKYGRFFNKIGLPVFSADYQSVVVDIGYTCGIMCSANYTLLLRRQGQDWQVVKILGFGIS